MKVPFKLLIKAITQTSLRYAEGIYMNSKKLKKETLLKMVANHEISALDGMVLLKDTMDDADDEGSDSTLCYYTNRWVEKNSGDTAVLSGKNGLIFDRDESFYNKFKREFKREEETILLVLQGENFEIKNPFTIVLNPYEEADYIKLFQYLKSNNIKIDFILHLWSEEQKGLPEKITKEALTPGIFSLLGLVKGAIAENLNQEITLLYIFRSDTPGENPLYQAAGAFARTARYEFPSLLMKEIEVIAGKEEYTKELMKVYRQEMNDKQEIILRYQKGSRYVRRLYNNQEIGVKNSNPVLPKEGCLLITGGLGGLGLQLAAFLHKRYNNPIVLLGRKSPKEAQDIISAGLTGDTDTLTYINCDISVKEQVQSAIDQAVKAYGSISCIFHVAGTLIDKYLARKEKAEFMQVALPKIQGAVNLFLCAQNNPPGKFVFFSSLAGIMGNIGQSDYAFSNCFLDCYSELLYAKGFSVSSINWPLWESGGMNISKIQTDNYKVQSGQELLPSLTGFKALEDIMRGETAQCFVSYGPKHIIPAFLNNGEEEISENTAAPSKSQKNMERNDYESLSGYPGTKKELWEETAGYLKGIFSALLKLKPESTDISVSFEELGVDSLLVNQFNLQMEESFHKLSKSILFEYCNIYELTKYLVENRKEDLIKLFSQKTAETQKEIPVWEDLELNLFSETAEEISLNTPVYEESSYEESSCEENFCEESSDKESSYKEEEIAVIGMSGLYPGADNVEEFWANLLTGKDSVTEGPKKRWKDSKLFGGTVNEIEPGKSYSKWGGFLEHIDYFDPGFFHLSPREAEVMDPQERLFLETAWHLFEEAGYSKREIDKITRGKKDIGVFVGVTTNTYKAVEIEEYMKDNFIMANSSEWSVANRVSYIMDFHGPSIAVDTACSSSLTALCLACDSIKNNTSSMAVVGGVNIYSHPSKYIQLCKAKMLSPTGKCHSFGAKGDGFTPGEGVGALLLKSLSQAKKDKDHIYGIIKGYSANHDGKTNGYTVPNPALQAEAIKQAMANARINSEDISYIEAHGTGTPLGDPIEVEGLTRAFNTEKNQFCALGSVKSNIGHTESSAGIAGITKILLQMKNKTLVPTLHSWEENTGINFKDTPFYLQKSVTDWEPLTGGKQAAKRIAGISSFGAGGSNAHVIIEEAEPDKYEERRNSKDSEELILLSGKSEESLRKIALHLLKLLQSRNNTSNLSNIKERIKTIISVLLHVEKDYLEDNIPFSDFGMDNFVCNELKDKIYQEFHTAFSVYDIEQAGDIKELSALIGGILSRGTYSGDTAFNLKNIAYTLMYGREAFEKRLAVTASSVMDLSDKLNAYLDGEEKEGIFRGVVINPENYAIQFEMEGGNSKNINGYLLQRNLESLAKSWVSGTVIDWDGLFRNKTVRRLSLPLYPFDNKSYWVPIVEENREIRQAEKEAASDLLIMRKGEENTFYLKLKGTEFFLTDHNQVLPAALYLEIARKMGEYINPAEELTEISDVSILKSFLVPSEQGGELKITYKLNGDKVHFDIQGSLSNNNFSTYCTGTLVFNQRSNGSALNSDLDIPYMIQNYKGGRTAAKEYYEQIEELNAHAGYRLKGLQEFYSSGTEGLGILKKAPNSGREGEFVWDPAVLDGGIRTADALGFLLFPEDKRLHIPFTLGGMRIYAKGTAAYAYIKYKNTKNQFDVWDISYLDENRKLLYCLNNFCTSRISLKPETEIKNEEKKKPSTLVEGTLEWSRNPLTITSAASRKKLLLFSFEEREQEDFYQEFGKVFSDITVVNPTAGYYVRDRRKYYINPLSKEDYLSLLTDLERQNLLPDYVLFSSQEEESELLPKDLEQGMNRGFFSLLYFMQSVKEINVKREVKIIYLYPCSSYSNNPVYASLGALARTARLENHNCRIKVIGIDRAYLGKATSQLVLEEFEDNIYQPEVLYKEERNTKSFKRIYLEQKQNSSDYRTPIKRGGAYLITGGLGGLGLLFAKYLGETYDANIILTGRSRLTAEKEEKLRGLIRDGLKIEYLTCDIGDYEQTKDTLDRILNQYPKLNGVLHSAGNIKDGMINHKSAAAINEVMLPKVWGLYNLITVLKDRDVDFILAFSSLSGAMGNIGQADYAYANSFMDHMAADKVTQGIKRLISINWPLWDKGGMSVSEDTKKLFLDVVGMVPLSLAAGIRAFEEVLNSNENNVLILEGDENKIENVLSREIFIESNQREEDKNTYEEDTKERFFQDFESFTGDILKLTGDKIDRKLNISSYGFDSISFGELAKVINTTFDTHISPALFFGHQTLEDLAAYIYEEGQNEISHYYKGKVPSTDKPADMKETFATEDTLRTIPEAYDSKVRIAEWQKETQVAVVGMSGRFPGSGNLEEYWKNIIKGESQISEIPIERWDWREIYGDPEENTGKTRIKWGGFIEDIDKFDPLFFNISPKDAIIMDPQERLVIEEVWKAVEDAGYSMDELWGSDTDVYIGMSNSDYKELLVQAGQPAAMTNSTSINRISYLFNLRGASEPVDTACSSSLVAIEKAYKSILNGNKYAIAGGVNVIACPNLMVLQSKAGMLSETGQCNTFDESANGYVRGEGVGILILKRLSDAVADKDHIYGILKAAGVNHGGHGSSITAPNMLAQAQLIADVYEEAGISPLEISYIEAHGTGTRLGDPVEINGLKEAFKKLYKHYGLEESQYNYCALGAVKTVIGHLESASGIAGVIKVLLAMKHNKIPKLGSLKKQNSMIQLEKTPFYIPGEDVLWKSREIDGAVLPRVAGISSFGIGGVNAHVVMEEYIPEDKLLQKEKLLQEAEESAREKAYLIPVSAESKKQLKEYAQTLFSFLLNEKSPVLEEVAYVLQTGRKHNEYRAAYIAENREELMSWLERLSQGLEEKSDSHYPMSEPGKDNTLTDSRPAEININRKPDLEYLRKEWLTGKDIPWKNYYLGSDHKPYRISLPSYPFERERFWFSPNRKEQLRKGPLSKLLAENNSTLLLQQYSAYAAFDTFYVKDHRVMGKNIVPGAVMVEMMWEALELGLDHLPFYLHDITFIKPLEVKEDNTEIITVLLPGKDSVTVKVGTGDDFCAIGYAAIGEIPKDSLYLDIPDIKEDCSGLLKGETLYELLRTHGLELGESFRSVDSICFNSNEALASLRAATMDKEAEDEFYLNPVLLDGAFQSIIGRFDLEKEKEGITSLPYSAGKILKYKSLPSSCHSYVTKSETPEEDNTFSFDILITDKEGEVLVSIKDYKVRILEREGSSHA